MTGSLPLTSDFRAIFRATPDAYLLLTADLTIVDASDAYLRATHTDRALLAGCHMFAAFPDNPRNPADGAGRLRHSLTRVLSEGAPHRMAVQRYDLLLPDGSFEERWWHPLNTPVLDATGRVGHIIHRVEEAQLPGSAARAREMAVALRASLREANEIQREHQATLERMSKAQERLDRQVRARAALIPPRRATPERREG